MANHSDRYQRRCADLGVDGEYRVGKLVFVCKLTSNRKSAVCGALMLCDCGLFCKLTMPMLNGLREYGEPLPWECQTCQKWRKATLRASRSKRLARLAKEARRLPSAPHVSLRALYPSEYMAWKGAKFNRCEPMCQRWSHRKVGFKNFLHDLGSKPTPKARLTRRDNNHMHNKSNTYWRIPPPPKCKPKPVSDEEKFVLKFKPFVLPPPPIRKNPPIFDGDD